MRPIPPHSGYHWNGRDRLFFEGWYHRLTLAEGQSYAFMTAIQNPIAGQPHCGGVAQVLLPDPSQPTGDRCIRRSFPDVTRFAASRSRLAVSHTRPGPRGQEFYRLTGDRHQGHLTDPGSGWDLRWDYAITPLAGWGNPATAPQALGGWVSYLPIVDPGWQVLMADGRATGWIECNGDRHEFTNVPAYTEKNWGRRFPRRWIWIQGNGPWRSLDSTVPLPSQLSVTMGGGDRERLWPLPTDEERYETLGGLGIHVQSPALGGDRLAFFDFLPANSTVRWSVEPWGWWWVQASSDRGDRVELWATAAAPGTAIGGPTAKGFVTSSRHTLAGKLELRYWQGDRLAIAATSHAAALETGGDWPGHNAWHFPTAPG